MDGAVILNKEAGISSRAAAKRAADILGEKRFGHAGALDVMARGVLVVLLGYGVRLTEYVMAEDKHYTAQIVFGTASDTLDIHGQMREGRPLTIGEDELSSVISSFQGPIMQEVPAFSALKYKGKAMYKYAREGIATPPKIREINIYDIRLLSSRLPESAVFEASCSKGTYIRSLCRDIGEAAGADAVMGWLNRTASGDFTLQNAYTLAELENLASSGRAMEAILPPDILMESYDRLELGEDMAFDVSNGRMLDPKLFSRGREGQIIVVYVDGAFSAIAEYSHKGIRLRKVFLKT